MADRETLLALKERVEKASGPDREIDRAFLRLEGQTISFNANVTASIDAALALCERILPGFYWRISRDPPSVAAVFGAPCWASVGPPGEQEIGHGQTAPLAILSALLSALSQQPAQDGDAG